MKTDGTVVMKITAPPEAGFKAPNEWRPTAAVPAPDGSIFIANGYGDSRIFRFDQNGEALRRKETVKGSSTVLMALPSTCVTSSLCCWYAIGKTGACATSTLMANTSAR
jgi:hypothetical protein